MLLDWNIIMKVTLITEFYLIYLDLEWKLVKYKGQESHSSFVFWNWDHACQLCFLGEKVVETVMFIISLVAYWKTNKQTKQKDSKLPLGNWS